MRAVVVERYGPPEVARVVEVATPEPRPGEVLVRVHAAAVTSGDARMRAGEFPPGFALPARLAIGIRGPRVRVLGVAFSGEVAVLGPGVAELAVGDRVAGMTGAGCGAHAEYVRVKAARARRTPDGLGFDAAAAVLFGGSTALDYLDAKAALTERGEGARVLVNGASGAVGSAAVQLAHHLGAHVTAVTSAANADFVRGLGADRAVDYRSTPLEALAASGERFDVVLDAVGNLSPATGRPLLADGGALLLAVASLGQTIGARGNVKAGPASEKPEHLSRVLQLAADGVFAPLIEASHPLDEIAQVYARIDSGRKVGNIVVLPQDAR
ncbi:NAD(P)-dependent alcohol dehydrogenase [Protaetiibacter sp. SSC-01]|uniref:NAD(P)-dependent alcohol dehydrogenase n=1 Tax=Protaetiibacter sp. SSC-01 TaxID=2759943 RepID=UPI001656C03F|nr:NAD(P)-dependent alcohol dehydrogenase [Protaetiibacter sp. SSC-01]QNO38375.1 NAD(P)-dependent alcohol dehydrogenase [Protaetiibacter sp. SSC-01]